MNLSRLKLLTTFLLLCGCTSQVFRAGDFTAFFVDQLRTHQGALRQTNGLPIVKARWKFQSDANGFECLVYGANFSEIDAMITNALGSSDDAGDQTTGAASRYRLYKASSIGVGLLIKEKENGVQLNCITGGWFAPSKAAAE